jgi:8-oxo-dGTP pyrophosphatase MutT (NUDIX family)
MSHPEAAVAIVCARQPVESVLLMRRSEREDDPWSGHWSFPGGRRDPEDPDLLHTALRELAEECGVLITRENLAAELAHSQARRKTPPYLMVAPFVFAVEHEIPTVLDAREAAGSLWVPLTVLRDPSRHALLRAPGRPREFLYPGIALDGTPLWGFTYRLITDWLGLVTPASGSDDAAAALKFLQAQGLVEGAIPVDATLAHFSQSTGRIPALNWVEVSPGAVRIVDREMREHVISAKAIH